jgi:hypothetical protein
MNGLNRFGANFNPYTPQTYAPQNYSAPLLPPAKQLGTQGASPLLGLVPDVLGGSAEGVSASGGGSGFGGFSGFGGQNGGLSPAISTGLGMAFGPLGMVGAYGLNAIGQAAAANATANAPAGYGDSSGGAVGAAAGGSGIGPGVGDGGYGADGTGPGTGASEGAGGGGGGK